MASGVVFLGFFGFFLLTHFVLSSVQLLFDAI